MNPHGRRIFRARIKNNDKKRGGAIRPASFWRTAMRLENKFDFHTHSNCSDGADSPAVLVNRAKEAGIRFLALTDHDTVRGYPEAAEEGKRIGLPVLPAIEMDSEFAEELHILGLGIDPFHPGLISALETALERRNQRNRKMLRQLKEAGCDIHLDLDDDRGTITRFHFALALRDAGYAKTIPEAFENYLKRGKPGYYRVERFSPKEIIAIIRKAGGVAAIAHPCHLSCDVHGLVAQLKDEGLGGIEAYYATATEGQKNLHLSLARQYGLLVTAGSDYHGPERPRNRLGCAFEDVPVLQKTFDFFRARV